jgi:UDP-N-acetylmuramyl pentapeptide phosphotransferase/UDP-N-acetylglucosamine-1-phosphate transferase
VAALLAFALGIVVVRLLRLAGRGVLASPTLARENYRGIAVPTAGGLYIVLTVLFIEAARAVAGALGVGKTEGLTEARTLVVFAVVGFGLLGLLDDLLATGDHRGFRGHVRALVHGELTTGMVKLAGGGALAIILVATPGFPHGRRLLVDAVVIALAANLGNLFDRAPGRTIKVAIVCYVPLAIALGANPVGVAIAPTMGASVGLLGDDLRERLMLGDTGANVIGAVLGLGVVLGTGPGTRLVALVVLVVLNVASELVSFTSVINRTPPLRAADQLGRLTPPDTR